MHADLLWHIERDSKKHRMTHLHCCEVQSHMRFLSDLTSCSALAVAARSHLWAKYLSVDMPNMSWLDVHGLLHGTIQYHMVHSLGHARGYPLADSQDLLRLLLHCIIHVLGGITQGIANLMNGGSIQDRRCSYISHTLAVNTPHP